jgi:hypothetical protein
MQGIYRYMPETNDVSRVHSVAAVMWLQHAVHVILLVFPTLNVCTFYIVLPEECVQCLTWLFAVVPSYRAFKEFSQVLFE